MIVTVQPTGVTPADVLAVARLDARVEIAEETVAAMAASRAIVDGIEASGRPVYGVSTGFGALANTSIAPSRRAELQHALIRSHAAGVGAPMPREVVRAMMLLRLRSLALGHSGVRPVLAQGLADLLNHGITPWVPEHGSLGASGDLAPWRTVRSCCSARAGCSARTAPGCPPRRRCTRPACSRSTWPPRRAWR
jgi:histidine ammonia-lyase